MDILDVSFSYIINSIYAISAYTQIVSVLLDDLAKDRVDSKKPREEGLTLSIEKLRTFDRENFEILAPMIDVIKIYSAFPLLIPDSLLQKKIKFYHDCDIQVSTGSTLTEFAVSEDSFDKFLKESARVGFDIIERILT